MTILQGILLLLALIAFAPMVLRFFKAPTSKDGFKLLLILAGILGIAASFYRHATRIPKPMDPKVYDRIQQLDAANVSADIQRFHQDHPEVKSTVLPESLSDQGIVREFDRAMMTTDVPALSEICKRISAYPISGVTIRTITDNAKICGITRVERPSERDERLAGTPRRIAIYQYEMTDSKGKPFGATCYLAVSWSKQSGSWALESAIATGSFFKIDQKP